MNALRWELRKLAAQPRLRGALLACLIGPLLVAVVLHLTSGLPTDTLYGRHVRASSFALPLLLLGFAGAWVLPLLGGLVAAESFGGEHAYSTWPALLARDRTRAELFRAKVCACALAAVLLLIAAAGASVVAGLLLAGPHPLADLSGGLLAPHQALPMVVLSWLSVLPPLLAFTCIGALGAVVGRGLLPGVGLALLLGLVLQLLAFVGGLGRAVNALPVTAFVAWHGFLRADMRWDAFWQGSLVSLAWAAVALVVARQVLLRRDIT